MTITTSHAGFKKTSKGMDFKIPNLDTENGKCNCIEICHNHLPYERVPKIVLLSYFEYYKIWLSIFMGDHRLSNITKLTK